MILEISGLAHIEMKITITPGQAVTIHGWMRARESLTWGDILANDSLTFSKLLELRINEHSLHVLQPDLDAWVRASRVTLEDTPRLTLWGIHPIRDLKADLADIVGMRWSAETLAKVGVTYHDLTDAGLTPETMVLFNLTLTGWAHIGLKRNHLENAPPHTLYRLFNMSKLDVLSCLKA
jgi:hypothetical protein